MLDRCYDRRQVGSTPDQRSSLSNRSFRSWNRARPGRVWPFSGKKWLFFTSFYGFHPKKILFFTLTHGYPLSSSHSNFKRLLPLLVNRFSFLSQSRLYLLHFSVAVVGVDPKDNLRVDVLEVLGGDGGKIEVDWLGGWRTHDDDPKLAIRSGTVFLWSLLFTFLDYEFMIVFR